MTRHLLLTLALAGLFATGPVLAANACPGAGTLQASGCDGATSVASPGPARATMPIPQIVAGIGDGGG